MRISSLVFSMSHMDGYAIIEGPCTVIVRCNSRAGPGNFYTSGGSPRWVINLKAVSEYNFNLLQGIVKEKSVVFYDEVMHLVLKGAIWEDQVDGPLDLPVKGENVIATFDYVEGILRCTAITLIPRKQPKIFSMSAEIFKEMEEFEKIIKDINNE